MKTTNYLKLQDITFRGCAYPNNNQFTLSERVK